MRSYRWFLIILVLFFVFGCAKGGTYLVRVQYQPVKEFSSLPGKVGPTLGLVPFKDERSDQLYIGRHTPHDGPLSFFKSDPFPLNQAMIDSISRTGFAAAQKYFEDLLGQGITANMIDGRIPMPYSYSEEIQPR